MHLPKHSTTTNRSYGMHWFLLLQYPVCCSTPNGCCWGQEKRLGRETGNCAGFFFSSPHLYCRKALQQSGENISIHTHTHNTLFQSIIQKAVARAVSCRVLQELSSASQCHLSWPHCSMMPQTLLSWVLWALNTAVALLCSSLLQTALRCRLSKKHFMKCFTENNTLQFASDQNGRPGVSFTKKELTIIPLLQLPLFPIKLAAPVTAADPQYLHLSQNQWIPQVQTWTTSSLSTAARVVMEPNYTITR